MYIPGSTYRLQANCNFQFHHIKDIISYLDQLGITTVYCAPFFQSRDGSNHGYDVINPHVINPELGNLEQLQELAMMLRNRKMGWLQDIVPNHMAYDYTNVWLRDIFEKGIHSDFAAFFDIDWSYQDEQLKGKVLMPFLSDTLSATLSKRELELEYNQQGFFINYKESNYPLSWSSYYYILAHVENENSTIFHQQEYQYVLDEFKIISEEFSDAYVVNEAPQLKEKLYQLYLTDEKVKSAIHSIVQGINNNTNALQSILNRQHFALAPYHLTDHAINYRRFFIVNELICLQMEKPEVFSHYHQFLKTLIESGLIQGLRVDHIDGLSDPTAYLDSLRTLAGRDRYIIVEKILEAEEMMPSHWPIQGTSGYEFLSCINHLFTKQESKEKLTNLYHEFIGSEKVYDELTFEKKHFILTTKMNGELENILALFISLDSSQTHAKEQLKDALAVFLANFSVYRTYVNRLPMHQEDQRMMEKAFENAESRRPELHPQFQFIKSVLFIEPGDPHEENKLKLLIRLQQFTGPLAAKGIEDTVFYIYNRLISHNEVGDCPNRFGMSVHEFHENMKQRLVHLPLSINATSTHDTKRGEDARMRINVLSEIPEAWSKVVLKWQNINARYKQSIGGTAMPDANDEYFIYQSLLGGFPSEGKSDDVFLQRFRDFMTKAVREGRTNSDWAKPNEVYEQHVLSFVDSILHDEEFMSSFLSFWEIVKHYGMLLSLAQTLIKITAPGIPDTFQGSELWDLSFVDPDNRRAIDFQVRKNYLSNVVVNTSFGDRKVYLNQLMNHAPDGRIKLYTIWVALNERRKNLLLFQYGEYIPLTFIGAKKDCLIGYARKLDGHWSITVTPKEAKQIGAGNDFPLGEVWEDTILLLPPQAPDSWHNVFTDEVYHASHDPLEDKQPEESDALVDASFSNEILMWKRLPLNEILKSFPIALIKNKIS